MAIAAEQLKELTQDTQTTSYSEKGVSVSVVADLLGVESEDLRKAMEEAIPVFNGKGYGTDSYIYKKPMRALWAHVGWWNLKEQSVKQRLVIPLIIGWFGRTLEATNLTRHVFDGEEYKLSWAGVLIHTHTYVDLKQHKEWLTLFEDVDGEGRE